MLPPPTTRSRRRRRIGFADIIVWTGVCTLAVLSLLGLCAVVWIVS